MKISIRKRFTTGMVFFFVIIASITLLSVSHLNNLSKKTDTILQDNHISIIYAQDMAENLTILNQELTQCFVTERLPDTNLISRSTTLFEKSLSLEKLNITETGEDEFYDISLVFNNMAHNLSENKPQVYEKPQEVADRDTNIQQLKELKRILEQMEATRERANELIAKLGNKL